ncbi:hypothetical protein FBY23_2212 [Nocardioides sp. SLBN-35]|nr:hypothetical protein FBY23_2212 [Nocardioides sp. SLBN-35]
MPTALTITLTATPARADIWPAPGIVPDRGTHTYCWAPDYPPNGTVQGESIASMTNFQSQTGVGVAMHSPCQTGTDVRIGQEFLGIQAWGSTQCAVTNPSTGFCDRWRVRINFSELRNYGGVTEYAARKTVCHEIGHTAGMAHYGNGDPYYASPDSYDSCMISGYQGGGQAWTRTYGAHHIAHVQSWW